MDDGSENPRKPYFLQLGVDALRDVNAQCNKNIISYARKAMI